LQGGRRVTRLEEILASTRRQVERRKRSVPLASLESRAAQHTPRGFVARLRERGERGPAVIAELKKASPSKGLIREDFDARVLAGEMEAAGAAALSVLTDEPYFQGSLSNLEEASAATGLPCLRKDFMVDEYQVVEARAHGADAILLIAAALADSELRRLSEAARGMGLDVLYEAHTAEEARRVGELSLNPAREAIGVNNRDLRSFEVRIENSLELARDLPAHVLRVAESGIRTAEDFARLHAAGFGAFLIGETFMRQPEPGAALARWIREASTHVLQQA
jgi:indole-3-glycerol phosphate synthase